jgi:mersacidin/lichenicidin family type 2 lantibiotic
VPIVISFPPNTNQIFLTNKGGYHGIHRHHPVWKGKEGKRSLNKEQRVVLPEHPAGLLELADAELDAVQGAGGPAVGLGPTLDALK